MSHSPVLFESDDETTDCGNIESEETPVIEQVAEPHPGHLRDESRVNNLRSILKGVPPPPNYTIAELNIVDLLNKYHDNKGIFGLDQVTPMEIIEDSSTPQEQRKDFNSDSEKLDCPTDSTSDQEDKCIETSSDVPKHITPETESYKSLLWPEVTRVTYFDVYYNLGNFSEELATLVDKFRERYVSSETNSSFITQGPMLTGSAKKRARRRAWGGYSPGRRLSHLAQRRRTFSSANLSQFSTNANGRVILPGGSNNNKSAVSKKVIMVDMKQKNAQKAKSTSRIKDVSRVVSKPNINQSKRALFQSPDQLTKNSGKKERMSKTTPNKSRTSKRALWPSSDKKNRRSAKKPTPKKTVIEDSDEEEERVINANGKRLSNENEAGPCRKNCKKSLTFTSEHVSSVDVETKIKQPSEPLKSQIPPQQHKQLSQHHKQKMVWAVASSLKQCGINGSHELFRPAGTVLFKKCRQVWLQQLNNQKSQVKRSTSEQMFEIAIKYAPETVRKLKVNANLTNARSSLPSDNFVNINSVPCEEKSKSGFSKVSDIFFSVKNSQSSQEDPSAKAAEESVSLYAQPLVDATDTNSNSNSLISEVSFSGLRDEKSTEISHSEFSNSTTDNSIEKNLQQIFDGCSVPVKYQAASDSPMDLPKIFDEESQMSQFPSFSSNTPSSKPNLSIDKLSSDSVFNKPVVPDESKAVDESLKKIVDDIKTDVEMSENDSGFIDNDYTSKSSKSSLDVKSGKIDAQSPTTFTAMVSKLSSPSVGKENEPLKPSANLVLSTTVESVSFSFKKFGTAVESVEPLTEKDSNCKISNLVIPAQFDETAMSSCDISVGERPKSVLGDNFSGCQ
nr:PREDICTED: uncharacterized protein LOC109033758 [Bemisia tabaci]